MGALEVLFLAGCVVEAPPAVEPPPSGDLVVGDTQNYTLAASMDAPTFVAPEHSDVAIDWSALTADFQCHDLDPVEDVDNVALIVFPELTEAEVEAGLVSDTLQQVDMGLYMSWVPDGGTTANLAGFTFFGTDGDVETYFEDGSGAWMLLFTTGTQVGLGARAVAFLEPSAQAVAAEAVIEPACGVMQADADIDAGEPVPVPVEGPWTLDWSGLTTDGQGFDLDDGRIDRVMIGWYADESVADLEANLFDLELLAEGTWTMEVAGTSADLAGLLDADGVAFPGFGADGTWVLALRCSLCRSPAPPFLAVLEPR